jgi:hypothetical protein
MFLAFLSMSFVGLALVAQALPGILLIAALVLAFDLVVGLLTYGRIITAGYEDYLARIRLRATNRGAGNGCACVDPA